MQIRNYAKSVFKMSLCTQDKKVEWPHAGRKSVLLIPVSCKTFVSLFSPAGPLRSPPVLRLTSDRAAPLSISKPSGRAFDSCVTLPGCSREVLPSTHLVVTSAVRLGGEGSNKELPGSATGHCHFPPRREHQTTTARNTSLKFSRKSPWEQIKWKHKSC